MHFFPEGHSKVYLKIPQQICSMHVRGVNVCNFVCLFFWYLNLRVTWLRVETHRDRKYNNGQRHWFFILCKKWLILLQLTESRPLVVKLIFICVYMDYFSTQWPHRQNNQFFFPLAWVCVSFFCYVLASHIWPTFHKLSTPDVVHQSTLHAFSPPTSYFLVTSPKSVMQQFSQWPHTHATEFKLLFASSQKEL